MKRRIRGRALAYAALFSAATLAHAHALQATPSGPFDPPDPIVSLRAASRGAIAADDWILAREIARRWIELEPDHDYPWILTAWADAEAGDFRAVVRSYNRALARNPDQRYQVFRSLALAYRAIGQFDHALVVHVRAAQINPNDARLWRELCDTRLRLGDADAAAQASDRALALESSYAEAWACRGQALARQERDAEAVEAFRRALDGQALERATNRASFWIALGNLYGRLREPSGVAEALDALERWDPQAAERLREEFLKP